MDAHLRGGPLLMWWKLEVSNPKTEKPAETLLLWPGTERVGAVFVAQPGHLAQSCDSSFSESLVKCIF